MKPFTHNCGKIGTWDICGNHFTIRTSYNSSVIINDDERIFVHVKHASRKHAHIMIKTVDSDVVVTAIADFHQKVSLNEIWVEFGVAKLLRCIRIHQIAKTLGPDQSLVVFLFFHAFSGCNIMWSISGKDKKSFFDTWTSMDEITPLFKILSSIATICSKWHYLFI